MSREEKDIILCSMFWFTSLSANTKSQSIFFLLQIFKLSTQNFTVHNLTEKGQEPVNCYMWHESEGKIGAYEIDTCLLHYLKEKATACGNDDLEIDCIVII